MPSFKHPLFTPAQFGLALQATRKARKLSQAALARHLGLSQSRVSHLELHPEDLSLAQLLAWCGALQLELSLGAKGTEATTVVSETGALCRETDASGEGPAIVVEW